MDKLNTTEFCSTQYKKCENKKTPQFRLRKKGVNVGSIVDIMLGVAACGVLVYAVAATSGTAAEAIRSARQAVTSQVSVDEAVGTLQFVSTGAAEVFGSKNRQVFMPVNNVLNIDIEDDGDLTIKGDPYCDVYACDGGEVVYLDEDTVKILKNDTIIEYGNLEFVAVEKGQVVSAKEVIGKTGKEGEIEINAMGKKPSITAASLLGVSKN